MACGALNTVCHCHYSCAVKAILDLPPCRGDLGLIHGNSYIRCHLAGLGSVVSVSSVGRLQRCGRERERESLGQRSNKLSDPRRAFSSADGCVCRPSSSSVRLTPSLFHHSQTPSRPAPYSSVKSGRVLVYLCRTHSPRPTLPGRAFMSLRNCRMPGAVAAAGAERLPRPPHRLYGLRPPASPLPSWL
ncbi:hypothetical protein LZ32DRAFT_63058 [Colletotrichum eremochloae]|nr:hypothetical protein LZ32DRAFT_63058 [Colletotrichum eremochloae]